MLYRQLALIGPLLLVLMSHGLHATPSAHEVVSGQICVADDPTNFEFTTASHDSWMSGATYWTVRIDRKGESIGITRDLDREGATNKMIRLRRLAARALANDMMLSVCMRDSSQDRNSAVPMLKIFRSARLEPTKRIEALESRLQDLEEQLEALLQP